MVRRYLTWACLCLVQVSALADTSIDSGVAAPRVRQVELFTTHALPVRQRASIPTTRYLLDAPARLLRTLGQGLPPTLPEARATVLQRLNADNQAWVAAMKQHYQGVLAAWSYRIKYLPAIVIDGRSVQYGVYDVDEALARYEERQHDAQ